MQVLDARREYVRWLAATRGLSPHTIRAYDGDLTAFERHVGPSLAATAIDRERLVAFLEVQRARGLAASTVKRRASGVRGLCRWLRSTSSQRIVTSSPTRTPVASLRDPRGRSVVVVSRDGGAVWRQLVTGLSTLVSSSHAENSYLVGLSLLRTQWLERYAERALAVAAALESELARLGVAVVDRRRQGWPDWPATHHVWVQLDDRESAFAAFERLEASNVHTNYRKLPYRLGHGLRLGTSFCAVAGICADDAPTLAAVVAAAITGSEGPEALRERVRELAMAARDRAILPAALWT